MNEKFIIIGGLTVILIVLYLMLKFSKWLRKKAYKLFLFAEKEVIKAKKMDYVVNQIYDMLFPFLRIIPKSAYKKILQNIFDEVHDFLDDGKRNKSNERR